MFCFQTMAVDLFQASILIIWVFWFIKLKKITDAAENTFLR